MALASSCPCAAAKKDGDQSTLLGESGLGHLPARQPFESKLGLGGRLGATPLPSAYMVPRRVWASISPCSAALRYQATAVESVSKDGLLALLATLEPLDDMFPNVDETLPPLDDVEL